MQRFPQVEENPTNALNNVRLFRSTDYIHTNVEVPIIKASTAPKSPIPLDNGRARSCSGGRNKALSPPVLSRKGILIKFKKSRKFKLILLGSCGQSESTTDIDKRTRKITHRIAELFSLIKENQSDR